MALLHDVQDRLSVLFILFACFQLTHLTHLLVALIGCTMLHWMTMPEPQTDNEHGTPQMHNIDFDKDSATVVETRQDSGSGMTAVNSANSEIKQTS